MSSSPAHHSLPFPANFVSHQSLCNPFKSDHPRLFPHEGIHPHLSLVKVPSCIPDIGSLPEAAVPENHPSTPTTPDTKTDSFSDLEPVFETFQKELTPEIKHAFDSMRGLTPLPEDDVKALKVVFPRTTKKTLVLDLDETLVRAFYVDPSEAKVVIGYDVTINGISNPHLKPLENYSGVFISIRPYAQKMLRMLSETYEIIMFTASNFDYAKQVAQCIDPECKYIKYILSREFCVRNGNCIVKDLRILAGRDLSQTIIIDNNICSFAGQLENGIYVKSFFGDHKDTELKKVTDFLRQIAGMKDVRPYVKKFSGIVDLYEKYSKSCVKHSGM